MVFNEKISQMVRRCIIDRIQLAVINFRSILTMTNYTEKGSEWYELDRCAGWRKIYHQKYCDR